jgi:hypothetical protein
MKKIIRLTEADLHRIVKKAIIESNKNKRKNIQEIENFFNPEALETGTAIVTMVTTVIGLLGVSGGFRMLYDLIAGLKKEGKKEEAMAIQDAMSQYEGEEEMGMEDDMDMEDDEEEYY